jgi:hypothetical protein
MMGVMDITLAGNSMVEFKLSKFQPNCFAPVLFVADCGIGIFTSNRENFRLDRK